MECLRKVLLNGFWLEFLYIYFYFFEEVKVFESELKLGLFFIFEERSMRENDRRLFVKGLNV